MALAMWHIHVSHECRAQSVVDDDNDIEIENDKNELIVRIAHHLAVLFYFPCSIVFSNRLFSSALYYYYYYSRSNTNSIRSFPSSSLSASSTFLACRWCSVPRCICTYYYHSYSWHLLISSIHFVSFSLSHLHEFTASSMEHTVRTLSAHAISRIEENVEDRRRSILEISLVPTEYPVHSTVKSVVR